MKGRATIYHGTPLTPRSALNAIGRGRAFCVSFFRPDDVEAVEAISPAVMFRQRSIFGVAGCTKARRRMVRARRLVCLLRVARAALVSSGEMGRDPRCARSAQPDQRQPIARMAVWSVKGRAAMAHGRSNRPFFEAGRPLRPRMYWLDRAVQRAGMRGMVQANGRAGWCNRQSMAGHSYDAWRDGRAGISLSQRGRDQRRAERVAL